MELIKIAALSIIAVVLCAQSHAAKILETASPGTAPSYELATAIMRTSWVGARFYVGARTTIISVGGHLKGATPYGLNTLFAAIVALDGPAAMPVSGFSTNFLAGLDTQDIVAHVEFRAPYPSSHVTLPMSAVIDRGHYALVFGSGLFGTYGEGAMPHNNPANMDQLSLMGWWELNPGRWRWSNQPFVYQGMTRRFVVEGFTIPEPGCTSLLVSALATIFACRPKRCD